MAKIYKLSTYIIDPDEYSSADDLAEVIECRLNGLYTQNTEIESSESFEWDDDLPINTDNCTKEELEKYFEYEPITCDHYHCREVRKPLYNRFTGEVEDYYIETEFYCTGTKELDTCDCHGNKRRCTFYKQESGKNVDFDDVPHIGEFSGVL